MRRLPPLTAIEAFVQVARTGSVKAAAEALALSSPALSRRLQSLERHVGHPLFDRGHQSVRLNPAGERLLADVGPSIDALALAMERASGAADLVRLRLSVLPLFASQRLIPHLAELRAAHPELHIDIETAGHGIARLDEGVDAAIVIATEVDPAFHARRIDVNYVVAIGARGLGLTRPADLARATVFLHRDLPDTIDYWREAVGLPDLQPAAIDFFDSGQLMLEAAAEGLGVAIMLESHLHGAHDPRLEPLFGMRTATPYSYWFVCRRNAMMRRPVRLFHDWLFESVGSDRALPRAA